MFFQDIGYIGTPVASYLNLNTVKGHLPTVHQKVDYSRNQIGELRRLGKCFIYELPW